MRSIGNTLGAIVALCLFAVIGAPAAHAGTITLTIGGTDTGTITLTETGNDTPITAISGMFDGSMIESPPIGAGGIGGNDNMFFTPAPYLDGDGVSFSLTTPDTNGYSDVNLYWVSDGEFYATLQANSPAFTLAELPYFAPDTVTSASGVPEPGTISLTLIGVGVVFAMRKRMSRRPYQVR
jgi:hypothetical protein